MYWMFHPSRYCKTYADVTICTILGFDDIPHEKRAKNACLSIPWAGQRIFIRDFQFRSSFHSFVTRLPTIPEGFSRALARVRRKPETAHEKPLLLVWAKDVASVQIPLPFSDFFCGKGILYTGYKDEANTEGFCHTRQKRVTCQKSRCWKQVISIQCRNDG